jgi:hypothetical protein
MYHQLGNRSMSCLYKLKPKYFANQKTQINQTFYNVKKIEAIAYIYQ